jgi:plasmid stability protein
MATIMIRNLDETTKTNLRLQAASHGVSMEEEARQLLCKAVNPAAHSRPRQVAEPETEELFGG